MATVQWLMRRFHRVNKIEPLGCSSALCTKRQGGVGVGGATEEISARGGQRKAINSVFSYIKTHPQAQCIHIMTVSS